MQNITWKVNKKMEAIFLYCVCVDGGLVDGLCARARIFHKGYACAMIQCHLIKGNAGT